MQNTPETDYRGRSRSRRPKRDKRTNCKRYTYGKDRYPNHPSIDESDTYNKRRRKTSKAPTQPPVFSTPEGAVIDSDSEYYSYDSSETSNTGSYTKTKQKPRLSPSLEVQHHDPEKEKGPLQIQTKQKTEQVLMSNQKTNTSRKWKRQKV